MRKSTKSICCSKICCLIFDRQAGGGGGWGTIHVQFVVVSIYHAFLQTEQTIPSGKVVEGYEGQMGFVCPLPFLPSPPPALAPQSSWKPLSIHNNTVGRDGHKHGECRDINVAVIAALRRRVTSWERQRSGSVMVMNKITWWNLGLSSRKAFVISFLLEQL